MIKILASQNLKKQAKNMLNSVFENCNKEKNKPVAFLSTELNLYDFEKITKHKTNQLVDDFSEKTGNDYYLNATTFLPLNSLLFLDLPGASLYRADKSFLDIQQLRRMVMPLKYKHHVSTIYIDNLEKLKVNELAHIENQALISEYKILKLYYMSKKFDLNFHIGMELSGHEEKPKFIKHLTYGDSFDMIDEIAYNK